MEKFKVGDFVTNGQDLLIGKIVAIKNDFAHVEFRTAGGGGCLPYALSELQHVKWCITTDEIWPKEIAYLAWQKPAWDEDGYYWTNKETMEEVQSLSSLDHPFLFDGRRAAIKHLKGMSIPQKCRVVRLV